ncbi:MAG TPA: cobalt-precorrin-6A reductase, partial [Hyphomicrobiales bacterium]|nr:cobalt-precorrin-6A reductase [Hyphomicrobiales bacterium]
EPLMPEGETRSGGFGGVAGLAAYLREKAVDLVADATHPFAARISTNAATACAQTGVPYLRLERPAWEQLDGDDWHKVGDSAAAAAALDSGARVLAAVGGGELDPFLARGDIFLVARMIEPPQAPVPANCEIVLARPPFALEEELELMREKSITVLVAKNSGGAGYAKLVAARMLKVPVVMIARPPKPAAPMAATAEGMRNLILASR